VSELPNFLSSLNPQQREAVEHDDGPAVVLAGAGSGKTRVLTTRVAYLLEEKNLLPENIVLLTFTNKAAKEMATRVQQLTGQNLPFAGTFHSLCARLLRIHGARVGLPPTFAIYDGDDQLSLIKRVSNDLDIDPKRFPPRVLLSGIAEAKQQLLNPVEYQQFARSAFQRVVAEVYTEYEKRLDMASAVDFDNLLIKTVELLRKNEDIRLRYQKQWQHVLIDEYQDTNHAQYVFTQLIAFPQNNLYVVGDASQAIYGWRGADYRNLHKLKNDYPHLTEYRLERNYRSTRSIVEAASQVIRNNTMHPVLDLWTEQETPHKIGLIEAQDGVEEAALIAKQMQRFVEHGEYGYQDMAVLYRTNAQSRQFEEMLLRVGIPYRLVGGVAFYARKEIKDVLAFVALFLQPNNEVSMIRASKLGKRRLQVFLAWAEEARQKHATEPQSTLVILDDVLKMSTYMDKLDEKDPEDQVRRENIQELRSVAAQLPNLTEFLEQIALVGESEQEQLKKNQHDDAVTLMSLHAAKGLEFPVVFLVGLEEGLFPHNRALTDREQMEEERRLCYVGITRARERLFVSFAHRRLLYGSYTQQLPARFLREIPDELLDHSLRHGGSSHGDDSFVQNTDPDDPVLDDILDGSLDIEEWLSR
jgi:DNA helicase II / ATP-dependent DNA helicase PcrA